MQRVEVEARDDSSDRDGGHAILLITGINHLDADVTFFLRPLDAPTHDEGLGALENELRPLSVRVVAAGVEMLVGPDVTEHPALLPGVSVEIELPEPGLWSEFVWPTVSARTRPKRAKIVASRAPAPGPMLAKAAPLAAARVSEARPVSDIEAGSKPERLSPAVATSSAVPSTALPKPPVAPPVATLPVAPLPVGPLSVAPLSVALAAGVTATRLPLPTGSVGAGAEREVYSGPVRSGIMHTAPATVVPASSAPRPAQNKSSGSVKEEPTAMKKPQAADAPARSAVDFDVERAAPAPEHDYVVFYPYARGGKLSADSAAAGTRKAPSILPTTRLGAAAAAAAALLAVQGLLWVGSGGQLGATSSAGAVNAGVASDLSLFDLFAVGPVSPRGVQARDTAAAKALENAQAALMTTGTTRDTDEASYWLRRFIISGGSDERTRRVLTQLGTTFADSANRAPDYGKARLVWELASAFGDPIAMCFVGTLNENGLGVPPDRKVALQWYERAKQAGGCPAVDDAIARAKK